MPENVPANVTENMAEAAARAAAAAAARLGVRCAEPVVLADGANVVVHLRPSPVVAKVAASTAAVRANPGAWLQRELDLAAFLAASGVPVLAPAAGLPAAVCRQDGRVMSFWAYAPRSGERRPDEGTIGLMLRDLHAALRGYPAASWPVLGPLGDIPAFLARPATLLAPADTEVLAAAYRRLCGELGVVWPPGQVLHGDAGAGNLMHTGGRWVWHDFEDTCAGPAAWDLAATTASPRLDAARILAAYGDGVDEAQLRACEGLRRLHLTIWYALYAERLPGGRRRAAELLASWRAPSG